MNQELTHRIDEVARINSDLENLMRSTDIATIFLDRELRIRLYTPPAAGIFNVIPTDVGRPLKHITHNLSPDDFSADAARVLKDLKSIEREVLSSDGRFFIARFIPYRDVADKISGVVLTFIDITERVVAREEHLRLLAEITGAQKFSDAVLEQMPTGVIVAHANEKFVFGNRRMADLLGSSVGGQGGDGDYKNWDLRNSKNEPLATDDLPMVRALRGETIVSEEMYLHQPDAGTTVVSVNAAPILGADGKIVGGVLAFEDITRRVEAEASLRASEERFRSLFESIDEGFCIVEMIFDENDKPVDYRFLEVSPSFEKQTGIKNAKGRRMREIAPEHEDYWYEIYGRIAMTGAAERFEDRADALDAWYDVYAFRFGDPHDRQVAILFNNITERKRTEEELREHRERLESLVAGRTAELAEVNETLRLQMEARRVIEEERFALLQKIVTAQEDERRRIARDMHDSLGQQLTALRLNLASLKTDLYRDGRIGEELEKLQELGKRIDAEVNFLVWELRPTVLDDLGLVSAIDTYVREWSRHYEINAEFHAGNVGKGRLDSNVETNLYRITQEALNNTHKHSHAKNANVVLEARRNEIVLVIEDDGVGFDPDSINKSTSSRSGSGLGLLGMRERAAIIGGTIEIESSPGSGTTVFVRVPIAGDGKSRGE